MSDQVTGPYDRDICHFCHKSGVKNPTKDAIFTAGFQRRETYANVGPWFDACQSCAKVAYEAPKQFQKVS